jgi:CBS domain containing-hemolysin-like protein
MDIIINLIIMLFLLIFKGFFSGSEIAMVNCDKIKMRHMAKTGNRGAQRVLELFETPDVILGTTLVGTNVATVGVSTLGAIMFINALGQAGDLVSVLILTPFMLILGEIVPKSVYQQKADWIAPIIIYPLRFFSLMFYPVIFIFSRVARMAARMVGGKGSQDSAISREGMRMLLEMSESNPRMENFDKARVGRILRFADVTAGEIMTPLAKVVGIRKDATTTRAIEKVWQCGYNRLPVYEGNITNVVGVLVLTSWDLMNVKTHDRPMSDFIHDPLYLSPHQMVDQVLPEFQNRVDHMGIIIDEFGSAMGILTREDVFEEVVGEMEVGYEFDEYHAHRERYTVETVGSEEDETYIMDGSTPLTEVNDLLHLKIPASEAHTLAGLIIKRLGHIPQDGEAVTVKGYRFTVVEATRRSIKRVHVKRT